MFQYVLNISFEWVIISRLYESIISLLLTFLEKYEYDILFWKQWLIRVTVQPSKSWFRHKYTQMQFETNTYIIRNNKTSLARIKQEKETNITTRNTKKWENPTLESHRILHCVERNEHESSDHPYTVQVNS